MRGTKFFGLALLAVVFTGTVGWAQNPPPPLNALVWTADSSGKSAPFVVLHPITGAKYISAFGKLDTTIVKTPQSIMWSNPNLLFMSVTKLNAQGNPDPATEVVFKGSTNGNNWSFNTVNDKWDPKTGTTGVFNGFAGGLYRITVKAKVDIVTMQLPVPKTETRDALLYTESFYVP